MFDGAYFTLTGYSIEYLRKISNGIAHESDENLYNTVFECLFGDIHQEAFCDKGCFSLGDIQGADSCREEEGLYENKNGDRVSIQIEI